MGFVSGSKTAMTKFVSFLKLKFHLPATSANLLLVNPHGFPKTVFPGDYTQENFFLGM